MTRCELATGLLAGYAAGELEPLEQAIVAEHLAECAACRDELARELRLRELMSELPAAACPDELSAAITAAVDAESSAAESSATENSAAERAGEEAAEPARLSPRPPAPVRPGRAHSWASTLAAASLLAAAVLLVLVLPRSEPRLDPTVRPEIVIANPTPTPTTALPGADWSQDDLDQAREEVQWTLAFTAMVIERAEKQTMVDVMRRLQEEAFAGFRERRAPTANGGRG
jgi:hypothetical protein